MFNQDRIGRIRRYQGKGIYPSEVKISITEQHDVAIHQFRGQIWLQLGEADTQSGIKIEAEIVLPTDGTLSLIQNVRLKWKKAEPNGTKETNKCVDSNGSWWLAPPKNPRQERTPDSTYLKIVEVKAGPDKHPNKYRWRIGASDNPGFPLTYPVLALKASANAEFRTILLWKPKGEEAIPIGGVDWSWSARVECTRSSTGKFGSSHCYTVIDGTKYYFQHVEPPTHTAKVIPDFNTPDPVISPAVQLPIVWKGC